MCGFYTNYLERLNAQKAELEALINSGNAPEYAPKQLQSLLREIEKTELRAHEEQKNERARQKLINKGLVELSGDALFTFNVVNTIINSTQLSNDFHGALEESEQLDIIERAMGQTPGSLKCSLFNPRGIRSVLDAFHEYLDDPATFMNHYTQYKGKWYAKA